jgi:hypothetical protein
MAGSIRRAYNLKHLRFSQLQGAAFTVHFCTASLPLGRSVDPVSRRALTAITKLNCRIQTGLGELARTSHQIIFTSLNVCQAGSGPKRLWQVTRPNG